MILWGVPEFNISNIKGQCYLEVGEWRGPEKVARHFWRPSRLTPSNISGMSTSYSEEGKRNDRTGYIIIIISICYNDTHDVVRAESGRRIRVAALLLYVWV